MDFPKFKIQAHTFILADNNFLSRDTILYAYLSSVHYSTCVMYSIARNKVDRLPPGLAGINPRSSPAVLPRYSSLCGTQIAVITTGMYHEIFKKIS